MQRIFYATIFVCTFLLNQFTGFSQPFTLVKDINTGSNSICMGAGKQPINLTELNGTLYFSVHTSGAPAGLWKSDGTVEGTVRVKEISFIDRMINVNGTLFFTTLNGLWKSDGTEAGTGEIKSATSIDNLTNVNGSLFFTISNELWKSDGTIAGTEAVKAFSSIQNIVAVDNLLFFSATENVPPYRYNLWKSDGSSDGTVLVKDLFTGSGSTSFSNFFNANGVLYFVGSEGTNGAELWKSDGTEAGTVLIKDIEPGNGGSNINSFCAANNSIYFFASTGAIGYGLWKTDGTAAGTLLVKDLGDNGTPESLTSINNTLFFSAYDDVNGQELWKSDGTEGGTAIVKDINQSGSSTPRNLINVNGVLYFAAINENTVQDFTLTCFNNQGGLWKSDGTEVGTVLVKNIFIGSHPGRPQHFAQANGTLFFAASNGLLGMELWQSNGTATGTIMVKDIIPTEGSRPKKFTAMNGISYFIAFDRDNGPAFAKGEEVYQTNGKLSGTLQTTSILSLGGSYPREIINLNGELLLSANNGSHGYELWKNNGLPLGSGSVSTMVKDINPNLGGGERASNPSHFTSVNQSLFFAANDGTNGNELWKSDGTSDGTVLVKDINPNGDSNPDHLLNLNGVLYFTANNGSDGIELWKSNGSDAGTVMVKNIRAGNGNSGPAYLAAVNGVLYFAADDGVNGIELWKSDGTEAGTVLVKNINAGINSSSPAYLTNVNGVLYFAADDGISGIEVWKSNGTDAGTALVKDINSGPASSNPNLFTNLNGVVLFAADDGSAGRELWGSNGTSPGTILIKDIQPGSAGSNPTVLTRVGGCVLFAANDGAHGNEIWLSTGTENGTRMVSEIEPGPGNSDPTEIFEYGSKVLVAATNAMVGSEVWVAEAPADISTLIAAITVDGPVAICTGKAVNLKANRGVGYTYQWKRAGVNIAGATQSNYTTTLGGYYTVAITDAFGATSISETVIVSVANPPLATVAAAGPLSFCLGKNVLLKAITGAGYTYQWKKAGVNIDNATSSSYTATEAGAYAVVVSNAAGCSTTSPGINVIVNNTPMAALVAAGPSTFCEGKTVQLKVTTGSGYIYLWKRGGAEIAGAVSSTYTATTTGTYSVVVSNASGCTAISAALNVVVKPLPVSTITPVGSTTFCSGKSVLLKANTGTNYTYQWKQGATIIPGAEQFTYTATAPGYYTVIVTNSSGCSVSSAAVAVAVNPLPVAMITSSGPLTFCAGQNVILKANTGTNYTYQWKKAGLDIVGATQVNYPATASGAYSVVVTNASGCPVTSALVTVTVNNAPLANMAAAGPTTFCGGKSVLLKAITGTGYTYQWKKNSINIPNEITSNYTATAAGNYSVVVSNVAGCSTASTTISVAVTAAPLATVAIAGPTTFCEGKSVLLKAIMGTGYTYQWKKNGVNIPAQSQSNFTANATGVYTVAVTNAEGCSTLSTDINVTVTPAPAAIITANGPLTFTQGGNVLLNASSAAGNTYQWKKDGVNITGATTESYSATAGGSYTVVVTNANGCQAVSQPAVITVTQTRPITKGYVEESEKITVYPNPLYRNDYVNIDWNVIGADKGVVVNVYDATGRRINSQLLRPGDATVKVKGASGVYLVELRWGVNKRKVFRVVKIE